MVQRDNLTVTDDFDRLKLLLFLVDILTKKPGTCEVFKKPKRTADELQKMPHINVGKVKSVWSLELTPMQWW